MYAALMACFKFFGPVVSDSELICWNSKLHDTSEMKKKGRPQIVAPIQEFSCVGKTQIGASRAGSCRPIWVVL